MFRDSLQRYSSTVFIVFDREIPKRNDADNSIVVIEHRKAADLIFLHNSLGFYNVLVLKAIYDFTGHDFFDSGALWISAIRDSSNRKIAIGKYTYEAVSVTDEENTYIKGAHLLRGFLDRPLRRDGFHVYCHNTIELHIQYGLILHGNRLSVRTRPRFESRSWQAKHRVKASDGRVKITSDLACSFSPSCLRNRHQEIAVHRETTCHRRVSSFLDQRFHKFGETNENTSHIGNKHIVDEAPSTGRRRRKN
jgi:hypothetical protein